MFQAATKSFTNASLRVVTGIEFGDAPELGIGTEDQVDTGAGPLELAGGAVAQLIHAFGGRGGLPLRLHVDQVDEEVIRQRPRPLGEDAVLGLPEVRIQSAHAADENRHFGSRQRQQLRPIH